MKYMLHQAHHDSTNKKKLAAFICKNLQIIGLTRGVTLSIDKRLILLIAIHNGIKFWTNNMLGSTLLAASLKATVYLVLLAVYVLSSGMVIKVNSSCCSVRTSIL